jgi:hypothetical protein
MVRTVIRRVAGLSLVAVAWFVAGCSDTNKIEVTAAIYAPWTAALGELVALTPEHDLSLSLVPTVHPPTADAHDAFQIAVVDDAAMPLEGYRIDPVTGTERSFVVHAHDVLGAQYGVADALEHLGLRFRHPFDTYTPASPEVGELATSPLAVIHQPQVRVRGFQVHTLHPIESYFATLEPSPGGFDDFRRIVDWVVKNRGNYLQWCPLGNIYDATDYATWQAYTRQLVAYAHARGVRVGLNIELFGAQNMQNAFDLIDDATAPIGPQIAARVNLLVDLLPFDVYDISFGEFAGQDPQTFITTLDAAATAFQTAAPAAEVHAVIHVGGNLLVQYMGQTMIYYFLVQFATAPIIADVHTVMYFDLFEPADGAYQMTDFSPHRQYLLDHMCANERASYFPEDAYWITFDDSVPLFLPLYVRSRWYDLQQLAAAAPPPCSPLDEHLVFSSGWEWSYWLHDTTSLRASYELPASPLAMIGDELAPDLGSDAAQIVSDLADAQHDALIGQSLDAYVAGRDALDDAGSAIGEISQPSRTSFSDLAAGSAADRATFASTVLADLDAHAQAIDALVTRANALALPDSRWASELRDGLAVDDARVHFVAATYHAVLDQLAGNAAASATDRAAANTALASGLAAVHHRDADLHDTHGSRLYSLGANSTIYPYGYLYMAHTLCYWYRELDQLAVVLDGSTTQPRSCDVLF